MEVTPVIQETADGKEVIADFAVTDNNHYVGRDGQVVGWEQDYVELPDGSFTHRFKDVELASDSPAEFNDDEYFGAVIESRPGIMNAIQWAAQNWSDDKLDGYNEALNGNDFSLIHRYLDEITEDYLQAGGQLLEQSTQDPIYEEQSQQEYEEESELDHETQEWVNQVYEAIEDLDDQEQAIVSESFQQLQTSEPEGYEVGSQWATAAQEAESVGDETFAAICNASAAFHNGEMSANEAIQYVVTNYPLKDVARAYTQIVTAMYR